MQQLIMILKCKEKIDFLVNFIVANDIVILEVQAPKMYIIATFCNQECTSIELQWMSRSIYNKTPTQNALAFFTCNNKH